jgi:Type IV secretory pathway, VirB3-like protein
MMKVLCRSGSAQDGADSAVGTQPSPETPIVSRFRCRTPVRLEPARNPGFSSRWTACSGCCVVSATLARPRSMTRMRRARGGGAVLVCAAWLVQTAFGSASVTGDDRSEVLFLALCRPALTWGVPFEALALNVMVRSAAGLELSAPTIRRSPIPFWAAAVPIHMLLRNLSGGRAGKAYSGVAVATFPPHQSLSWWIVPLASPWRGIGGFLGLPWPIVSLEVLEHIDSPLRGLAHRPRAKLGQSLIRRKISKQFGINVDRTDRDLKLCGLAQKIRPVLPLCEQISDCRQRGSWQPNIDRPRIHLSASHAWSVRNSLRFLQKPTFYTISYMRY